MTNRELIEKLKQYDLDEDVLVQRREHKNISNEGKLSLNEVKQTVFRGAE